MEYKQSCFLLLLWVCSKCETQKTNTCWEGKPLISVPMNVSIWDQSLSQAQHLLSRASGMKRALRQRPCHLHAIQVQEGVLRHHEEQAAWDQLRDTVQSNSQQFLIRLNVQSKSWLQVGILHLCQAVLKYYLLRGWEEKIEDFFLNQEHALCFYLIVEVSSDPQE